MSKAIQYYQEEIKEKIKKDGGCLCEVWSDEQKNPNKKLMIVRKIDENNNMIFNDGWSCVHYKYARPVAIKEIEKYIL